MSAGSIVYGQCVPIESVADVYFSAVSPAISTTNPPTQTFYTKIGAVWYLKLQEPISGIMTDISSVVVTSPSFPVCDTKDAFIDGLTLGWGVALAIIGAWAISNLRKGLHYG